MEYVKKELVIAKLDAKNSEDAISQLADKLYSCGYVNKDYKEAVLNRENIYPTGLPNGEINVAIPHTDVKYVNKTAIIFATLKKPVNFNNMADKSHRISVRFVVMLAMKEPHGQVRLLQDLMQLFQRQDLLNELIDFNDSTKLYQKLSEYFANRGV